MNTHFLLRALLVITLWFTGAASAEEYSFKVTNTTDSKITKLYASEDGEKWGFFDVGAGIKPGQTVEMVWGQHTNGQDCKQYFKAEFADGDESEPVIFNFCEKELELEF